MSLKEAVHRCWADPGRRVRCSRRPGARATIPCCSIDGIERTRFAKLVELVVLVAEVEDRHALEVSEVG